MCVCVCVCVNIYIYIYIHIHIYVYTHTHTHTGAIRSGGPPRPQPKTRPGGVGGVRKVETQGGVIGGVEEEGGEVVELQVRGGGEGGGGEKKGGGGEGGCGTVMKWVPSLSFVVEAPVALRRGGGAGAIGRFEKSLDAQV
jgi:hypothetical protein